MQERIITCKQRTVYQVKREGAYAPSLIFSDTLLIVNGQKVNMALIPKAFWALIPKSFACVLKALEYI